MKPKLITFILSLTFLFLFHGSIYAEELKVKREYYDSEKGMVLIPSGSFLMGGTLEEDQRPIHLVFVSAFYIDKYETTQKDFKKTMGYNQSRYIGPDLPVENINWFEAHKYCQKIGKRLPTEAEWEKAARGGTETKYFWGNKFNPKFAWYKKNSENKTHPTGRKQPNNFGLYDMSGNVWEWVSDWFEPNYFKFSQFSNPKGPKTGSFKTLKGGSWSNDISYLTLGYRMVYGPEGKDEYIGFRCVRSDNLFEH